MSKSSYSKLLAALENQSWIRSSLSLLSWDEQVNLPPASSENRARQNAFISDLHHRESIRPEIGEWLSELEEEFEELSEDEQTVVRWTRRKYDRARKLPVEFVVRKSELESRSFHAWAEARKKNDFSSFAPFLEKMIELAKEESDLQGWENVYDYHIDQHDPGMDADRVEKLFGGLRAPLRELIGQILDSPVKPDSSFLRDFPVDR